MSNDSRPRLTVIGGPNGSGKTTIYPTLGLPGEFVNGDEIAKALNPAGPESASLRAGREVVRRLDDLVNRRADIVYETTLSSRQSLALMERCRAAGYDVSLVFVILKAPELNIERIANRVAQGGHHISPEVVRRRYPRSLEGLRSAFETADFAVVLDNSGDDLIELAQKRNGVVHLAQLGVEPMAYRQVAKAVTLPAYSKGQIARDEAIRALGLRDYAELLVKLGDVGLPMPLPSEPEMERQAALFAKLWGNKE
jgi:predicted ABC-type ATPase